MSDETVANLGFAVDSKPLDDAKQKLKELSTEAGNTGKAVDDFNQKAAKTGDALGQATAPARDLSSALKDGATAAASYAGPLGALEAAAKRAGVSAAEFNRQVGGLSGGLKSAGADAVSFSAAQQKVASALDAALAKTQLTSAEMRVFQALQKSGATLETEAGRAIAQKALALDQALNSTKASTVGNTALGAALQTLFPAMTTTSGAVKALATEHHAGGAAMTEYREIVHSVGPALEGLGVKLSALTQFSYAARGGMAVLAAAAGGALLVEMGKSRDEIEKMDFRLQAFAGESNGARIGADLKKASDAAGVMPSQIAPAVNSIQQLQNALTHANPSVAYAPGYNPFDAIAGGANAAVRAVQTVTEQFKLNKLDTTDATKATNEFFASIQKNSGLTSQAFDKLINEAPTFAAAFAKAFGANNIYDFQKALQQLPIPLQEVLKTILKMGPTTDAQFKQAQASSKSFGDAVDDLQKNFKDMWVTISEGDQPVDTVLKLITKLSDGLKALPDWLKSNSISDAIDKWLDSTSISDAIDKGILNPINNWLKSNSIADGVMTWTKDNITDPISNWLDSYSISDALSKGLLKPIKDWLGSTSIADAVAAWAKANITDPIAAAAQAAASAAASALASIGRGVSNAAGAGIASGMDLGGGIGGDSGVGLTPSGDAGDIGLGDLGGGTGGATDNLPAFAGGGQLTVAGSGGTDSQTVSFKATPGEIVDVKTPIEAAQNSSKSDGIQGLTTIQGQPAAGVVSATPDPASIATVKEITDAIGQSTIDISKQVLTGSDNIVTALNKLIGGVASTTVNPATGLPISSGTSATGSSGTGLGSTRAGSGGGGGFTLKNSKSDEAKAQAMQKYMDAANKAAGPATDYGTEQGRGSSVGRSRRSGGAGTFRGTAGMSPYMGGALPANGISPFQESGGMSDFYGTNYDSSGDFYGSISDYGYGSSDFYGTDSGGSGDFYGSISDYGTAVPVGSGGVYGFDGGNSGGGFSSFDGYDPNQMNYGGGSADYGYFATGGKFTVGGDGGTDTTKVSFHATKGETVEIKPANSTPTDVAMPAAATASSSATDPSAQQASVQTMTKNVTINVQAGIQADSFIRSRAQIARGI